MAIRLHSRASVEGSMPPLAKACADFKGFNPKENCTDQIYDLLLAVIQRHRGAKPKRFYTMREVAAFFQVGLGTVVTVFRRLKQEGLLTLIRSSQTMIPARVTRPRLAVRGVVCMPIWLPGFLQFQDWRTFFSQLEEELSRHRFVLEPIFFQQGEDAQPDFVERILKFNPDYLLWHHPASIDDTIIRGVADTGVGVLVIQNTGELHYFTGRIYWQSYVRGLRQGLKEWRESGEVDRIIIPQGGQPAPSASRILPAMLKECPLPHQYQIFPYEHDPRKDFSPLKDFLRRLSRQRRTGIIFDEDLLYVWACGWMPNEVVALFSTHRVMVMRQAILPATKASPDVTADTLLMPGRQLARRIAADLNKGYLPTNKIVFEAEWRPKTPLSEVAPRFVMK